jgi:hypothetical protein
MRRASFLLLVSAILLAAGCDDKPDPHFEQAMKDRAAQEAGDPYNTLNANIADESRYERMDADKRGPYLDGQGGTLRANYVAMLKKLDEDHDVAHDHAAFITCRPIFEQAASFGKEDGSSGNGLAAAGQTLFSKLSACRDQAIAAGGDGKAKETAKLLRRFASVGMVLTSVTMVAKGAVEAGISMWRTSAKLAADDQPGFKLNANNFTG